MAHKKSPLSDQNAVRSDEPEPEVMLDLGPPAEPEPPMPSPHNIPIVSPDEHWSEPTAPVEDERAVVVATSAGQVRTPRYRVLNEKKLSWQANVVHFRVGEEFDASTHSPVALEAFKAAGLEIEQIE